MIAEFVRVRVTARRGVEWALLGAWLLFATISLFDGPTPPYLSTAIEQPLALGLSTALILISHVVVAARLRVTIMLVAIGIVAAGFWVTGWS